MAMTSVDIDAEVLRQAKSTLGVKTNRDAINLALSEVVQRRRQLEAIDVLAQLPLEVDPEKIAYSA